MKIIVTKNVKEYREAARKYVSPDDNVIEIGCASGGTTRIISKIARKVLAIDKSESELERAKERLSNSRNIIFKCMDAFNVREILEIVRTELNGKVDIVMIDIGGVEDPAKVLSLARKYLIVFKPKLIIIKNKLLLDFISKCTTWTSK